MVHAARTRLPQPALTAQHNSWHARAAQNGPFARTVPAAKAARHAQRPPAMCGPTRATPERHDMCQPARRRPKAKSGHTRGSNASRDDQEPRQKSETHQVQPTLMATLLLLTMPCHSLSTHLCCSLSSASGQSHRQPALTRTSLSPCSHSLSSTPTHFNTTTPHYSHPAMSTQCMHFYMYTHMHASRDGSRRPIARTMPQGNPLAPALGEDPFILIRTQKTHLYP